MIINISWIVILQKIILKGPEDCSTIPSCGVYELDMSTDVSVYCKNGWTTVMSRGQFGNPQNYFQRTWQNMKESFGTPGEEFWIGLDLLYEFTNQKDYALKIELDGADNVNTFALYHGFRILDTTFYTMDLGSYNQTLSTVGDSFSYQNGQKFTTLDVDNDVHTTLNCAQYYKGPYW